MIPSPRANGLVYLLHRARKRLARVDRRLEEAQLFAANGLAALGYRKQGWPQDEHVLRAQVRPVFVLSPGRSGTMTLSALFDLVPEVHAEHEPSPALVAASYLAWTQDAQPRAFWKDTIHQARDVAIFRAHRRGRVWFESNNRLTFLAEPLLAAYPRARFVLLTRKPEGFVASAMAREYYQGHPWDFARVRPRPQDPEFAGWNALPPLDKCAWLWARTVSHGLDLAERLGPEVVHVLDSEDLFSGNRDALDGLFRFVTGKPAPAGVEAVLGARLNAQKERGARKGRVEGWTDDDHARVAKVANPVLERLERLITEH
ncbi:MAG: hypothetical protein EP330_04370 [Deltaproteobacteria bacterium]|nr:MAG: hypothetical protein EP330_04370 [Deltaproteobacteria bacterium]